MGLLVLVGWLVFCFLKKAWTGTSYLDQADLEFRVILLPQLHKFWDYWHVQSSL